MKKPIERLCHYILRVPKDQSALWYFQLESCEGLCFYSTLKESEGYNFRDLDLKAPIEWQGQLEEFIRFHQKHLGAEIILNEIISDC